MSDKKDKILLKGSAKKHVFDNGGYVINFSLSVPELENILKAVNKKRNSLGHDPVEYLNLVIKERREVGEYGDTHYVQFEPWFPEPKTTTAKVEKVKADTDDLPF